MVCRRRFLVAQPCMPLVTNACTLAQSWRFVRCRRVANRSACAPPHLGEQHFLQEKSPERSSPTQMPLSYVQNEVGGSARYCTDDAIWGNDTIQGAWKSFHESLSQSLTSKDALKAQRIVNNDLVGLALCTSFAEVKHLLSLLAPPLRAAITSHPIFVEQEVEEFFIHLGQAVEVRGGEWVLQTPPPTATELQHTLKRVSHFGDDGRGCIKNTPHRVSLWRGRCGEPLGVTIRVGRFVPNVAQALLPLANQGSLLIVSKAGVGKTTLLRDIATSLSRKPCRPRVVVVDTSNEIGGDSPVPLPFLGRCRRIQVPRREDQGDLMKQVLQNHSPEYVVVDEISTAAEAEAAWSISQRGVCLIATCHGESLAGVLQNQTLNLLVGGTAQAFLSNEERRLRNKLKKTVLERPYPSPFKFVAELNSRNTAHVYVDVNQAVDCLLDEQDAKGNASIGTTVVVNQPPSERLMALLLEKQRRGQSTLDHHQIRKCATDQRDCTEDQTDDAGSESFGNTWIEERRSASSSFRRKKSDQRLLEDLQRFL